MDNGNIGKVVSQQKKSDQLGYSTNEVMGNPEVPTTATFPGPIKYKKMYNTQKEPIMNLSGGLLGWEHMYRKIW